MKRTWWIHTYIMIETLVTAMVFWEMHDFLKDNVTILLSGMGFIAFILETLCSYDK